jgi:hypothetical protein
MFNQFNYVFSFALMAPMPGLTTGAGRLIFISLYGEIEKYRNRLCVSL